VGQVSNPGAKDPIPMVKQQLGYPMDMLLLAGQALVLSLLVTW
jgi:hypothetical protein